MIALGLIGYLPHQESWTALIPALFGAVLLVLGAVGLRENARKHAMHAAAGVGVVGFIGAAARLIPAALSGEIKLPLAFAMQVAMAVVCGAFVGLCIKSFVDARRRRQQAGG